MSLSPFMLPPLPPRPPAAAHPPSPPRMCTALPPSPPHTHRHAPPQLPLPPSPPSVVVEDIRVGGSPSRPSSSSSSPPSSFPSPPSSSSSSPSPCRSLLPSLYRSTFAILCTRRAPGPFIADGGEQAHDHPIAIDGSKVLSKESSRLLSSPIYMFQG